MLINNEFVIQRYTGQLPLTLLAPPANMDAATQQQYNIFISNIVTIYGSQNLDGTVPVFFKSYNNTPSSSSTLTQLENGKEYYFISKNSSSFPYVIPAIGGSTTDSCDTLKPCCPYVVFSTNNIALSGPPENIYAYLSATASGLIPGKTYTYTYEPITANWPAKISPASGSFIAMRNFDTIDSVFSFCPTSGNCENYFSYTPDPDMNKDYTQKNIYSTVRIVLYPIDGSDCPIMSDTITVKCNKCLPGGAYHRPVVNISGSPKLSLNSTCCNNPIPLSAYISSADPGKVYSFVIQSWPDSITMNPASGYASFGDGTGKISTMIDMNNINAGVIKFSLNDQFSNETFVDFTSITCNTSC